MADNVAITAGTGTSIAADDIGGVLHQRVKISQGADGTGVDVSSAAPLQVTLANGSVPSHAVTNVGTFATQAASTQSGTWTVQPGNTANTTAWKVDGSAVTQPVSGTVTVTNYGNAFTRAAGASDANTQRVTIDSGQLSALGQTTMSASTPVTLASDQTWPVSTTGFMKKEDIASADGDAGIPAMVVRKATPANTSNSDGDYEFLQASAGSLWTATVATDKTLVSERVINGGSQYETVAVSQSNQVMGATGAAGDYLSHVICSPATAGCGVVTVFDNSTTIAAFPGGGTTALTSLIPFIIPIGVVSTSGAWKITTGANITAVGVGRFT